MSSSPCSGSVLKFRSKTMFAQCDICYNLKLSIRKHGLSLEDRFTNLKRYRQHLNDQYQDRTACWSLRAAAEQRQEVNNILVLSLDGMDQAKFAIPRDPLLKAAAAVAKWQKPRLKVHGVWCFGHLLDVKIMDETFKHDSACVIQLISECLEKVAEHCKSLKRPMPSNMVVLADNTVRENKNQHLFKYMSLLCAKNKMRCASMLFLRAHHTHDAIDQLWGILARRIANSDRLLEPAAVVQVLREELERRSVKDWLGVHKINVSKLDAARNWQEHLRSLRVHFEGGLLEDAASNHMFLFMQKRDLPAPLAAKVDRGSYRGPVGPTDIICLVKEYICSAELRQDPLLVLTQDRAQKVSLVPEGRNGRRKMGDEIGHKKIKNWLSLASALSLYGDKYRCSREYLRALAANEIHANPPPMPWHAMPGPVYPESMGVQESWAPHETLLRALAPSVALRTVWERSAA